jgi:hypothetical protein
MDTAKVFWSGRSQAVRLPKEFWFDTDEVHIRRHGATVILEPTPRLKTRDSRDRLVLPPLRGLAIFAKVCHI